MKSARPGSPPSVPTRRVYSPGSIQSSSALHSSPDSRGTHGTRTVVAHPGTSRTGRETIALSQMDESHTVSPSRVMTASGSSAFGVNEQVFLADVVMATSTKTVCRANCGLPMDGEMVTSRVAHAPVVAASVTRVVVPGGGVVGFGEAVGGRAVTVDVLVGFASSSDAGHSCTTTQATRIAAAKRSSHRRTYTERGCCLLTSPR